MLRQLRQAPVATQSTCCDQLVALPGSLAGVSEQDRFVLKYQFKRQKLSKISSPINDLLFFLRLQASLVTLTKSLGEVAAQAEASLAALQVLKQI